MIEIRNIHKQYRQKVILENICFQVEEGTCTTIIGNNGCGKTTLLQILAGIIKADKGELFYKGDKLNFSSKNIQELIGFVPQENPLMEELSVKDNLRLWMAGKKNNMEDLITMFQLEEIIKLPVRKLSGGMKRRLSIACAMSGYPPVLLLDEPTTALDLYYKENIHALLKEYQNKQGIIIMTTHDESEILVADSCFLLKRGLLTEGNGEDLIKSIRTGA